MALRLIRVEKSTNIKIRHINHQGQEFTQSHNHNCKIDINLRKLLEEEDEE